MDAGRDVGHRRPRPPLAGPCAGRHRCPAGHGHRAHEEPAGPAPTAVGGVVSDRHGRRSGGVGPAHPPRGHRRPGDHGCCIGPCSTPSRPPWTCTCKRNRLQGPRHPSLLRRALFEVPNRVSTEVATTGRIVKTVGTAVPQAVFAVPVRAVRKTAPDLASRLGLGPGPEHPPELPGLHPLTDQPPADDDVQHARGQPAQVDGRHLRATGRCQAGAARIPRRDGQRHPVRPGDRHHA